jgi:hypothetical protein
MGGLRGTGQTDITVSASPPLPAGVTPREISLQVPKRFARIQTGLSTGYLPYPTFSSPRILEGGKLIAFTLCVDASHISAGSYVGQVIVGGPPGVQPATVAITLNARDEGAFRLGIILALILAFLMLLLRGIKVNYQQPPANATMGTRLDKVGKAALATATDPLGFWAPSLIALGAAFAAMLQVYDSNVSWGADTIASLLALGGTAIAAAGVGTFLSSLKG